MTLETIQPEAVTGDSATTNGVATPDNGTSGTAGQGAENNGNPPTPANASPLDTMTPPGGPLPNPLNPEADDPRPAELPPLTR